MRHLIIACIFLICIHYSMQVPKYENCDRQVLPADAANDCVEVTCASNKRDFQMKGCAVSQCLPGKQVGYHNGDPHAEYPNCCSHPICKT